MRKRTRKAPGTVRLARALLVAEELLEGWQAKYRKLKRAKRALRLRSAVWEL